MIVPSSLTHSHMYACLQSELQRVGRGSAVQVLDAGCGNGTLLEYVHRSWQDARGDARSVDLYGFDVSGPGVQKDHFFRGTLDRLKSCDANVRWEEKLALIGSSDPWPYADRTFDVVMSNQVLEHVADHDHFFSEMRRVLKPGGVGIHCFPVRECVWEGHIHQPFVHWLRDHDRRARWIGRLGKLGLGTMRAHRAKTGISPEAYAERHADFLWYYTNYLSTSELLATCKRARLRASFGYTSGMLTQKLSKLLRLPPSPRYGRLAKGMSGAFFPVLKLISSITLLIEKQDSYRPEAEQ